MKEERMKYELTKNSLFGSIMHFERTQNYDEFLTRMPNEFFQVFGEQNHECLIFENYALGKAEDLITYLENKKIETKTIYASSSESYINLMKNKYNLAINMLALNKPDEVVTIYDADTFYKIEQREPEGLDFGTKDTINILDEIYDGIKDPIKNYNMKNIKKEIIKGIEKDYSISYLDFILINRKEQSVLAFATDDNNNMLKYENLIKNYGKDRTEPLKPNFNIVQNLDKQDFDKLKKMFFGNLLEGYDIAWCSPKAIESLIYIVNSNEGLKEVNKFSDYLDKNENLITLGKSYLNILDTNIIRKEYYENHSNNILENNLNNFSVSLKDFFENFEEGNKLIPDNGNIGSVTLGDLNKALEKENIEQIYFKFNDGLFLSTECTLAKVDKINEDERKKLKVNIKQSSTGEEM